ncbi:hypothetical protein LTR09_011711 [Extremus antarcticus]|uniref:Uncharacterized protein n=1 Tax=Extremus antarcticus TaxID=702011 RepID=A0AAJ0D5Q8_9PEZI|nr:hypothetical protein LTR09_011711 [Extremus antarcticus]
MSLLYDTAVAVVAALRNLRDEAGGAYKPPTVIQLRTASLNPGLSRHTPAVVTSFVKWGMHHLYTDISRACNLYQSVAVTEPSDKAAQSNDGASPLLKYIFADPPTIHDPDGTECTGYKLIVSGKHPPAVSYADLGAAMCELSRRREELANQAFGVIATGKPKTTWGLLLWAWLFVLCDRVWGLLYLGV